MSKAGWGTKRVCSGCGTRFYDLGNDPVVCPKCFRKMDPAAPYKPKRGRREKKKEKEASSKNLKNIAALVEKNKALPKEEPLNLRSFSGLDDIEEVDDSEDDIEELAELDDVEAGDDLDEEGVIAFDTQDAPLIDTEEDDDEDEE